MKLQRLQAEEAFKEVPPPWEGNLIPAIKEALNGKLVVLDDDPTGSQTVYDVPVLTSWTVDVLAAEFETDLPVFYILTNTRSLPPAEAEAINTEIGYNLRQAAAGRSFTVISRGDSALRGHFPNEVQALAAALKQKFDAWLFIPFFEEGGRYTIDDIHYVREGDWLIPTGQTPYAADASFGYQSSNLVEFIREKMGDVSVESISLEELRQSGPEHVTQRLLNLPKDAVCIVNAISRQDLDVFTLGLLAAERQGKRFLYRTAASFVAARAGLAPKPVLTKNDLKLPETGGTLFIVGSYVPKTSAQIAHLLTNPDVVSLEINVEALLSDDSFQNETKRVSAAADDLLTQNKHVVISTSRKLITGSDPESSLKIGARISEGLITIVQRISHRPRYWLSKGGITSSDVATKGLGVQRAMVLGQILPGVPVWRLGEETRFPGLVYVIFPGNVGEKDALQKVKEKLA